MKTRWIARPLALLGVLMLAAAANAQAVIEVEESAPTIVAHRHAGPPISLSDEQREKLGALKDQLTLDTATKKAQLKVQQRQLREMMRKPKVDRQAALALNAKINALRAELSDARLNFMLAAGDIFTPEQKEQMRGRFGKGGCCPDGHGGFRRGRFGPGGLRSMHGPIGEVQEVEPSEAAES